MEITRTNLCLHGEFADGRVTFGVFLSPAADFDDDELLEAIERWAEGEDVEMNFRFSVKECVEDLIDFHRYQAEEGLVMAESDRPMVEALRAELAEALSRLDSIRFEADEAEESA